MKPSQMIGKFNRRYPYVGPSLWMASIQYFIVMLIVALTWKVPYSILQNPISDLGNTACGTYSGRYVCSPLHSLMNVSFCILGLTMILGSGLIYREFNKSRGSRVGFSLMALAGFGTLLVGIFPENTVGVLHFIGALLAILIGNIGVVILGIFLDIPKPLRIYTLFSGIFALIALVFFTTQHYLGLGEGGMERLASNPQTMWLIVFGTYITGRHVMRSRRVISKVKH